MARLKATENLKDPATGRALPAGMTCRGPGQYRARKSIDGKRVNKVFDTAKMASDWLMKATVDSAEGVFVDRSSLDRITLKEIVEQFKTEVMFDGGPRMGAKSDREAHIPRILGDDIAKLPLSKLTTTAVLGVRDRMVNDGFAKSTIVKRMNLLSGIIKHARSEWGIAMRENPAAASAVKRPAGADLKRDRKLEPLSEYQISQAAEAGDEPALHEEELMYRALASEAHPHDAPFVRFCVAQATRRGEAMGLRWRDVDFERRIITLVGEHGRGVKNAKSKEEKGPERRPLMPKAAAVLRGMLPAEGKPDPNARIFDIGTGNAFSMRFGRKMKRAGLDDLHVHDVRHEATTRLASIFANALDLKRVTGHKNLKSLDRYYHPNLTNLALIAQAAEDAEEAAKIAAKVPPAQGGTSI